VDADDDELAQLSDARRIPGLFGQYVNVFLKMKEESTGWPTQCKTDKEKRRFLREYKKREGIDLDAAELDKGPNPSKRNISKLLLNSLWGKFCQRSNLNKTVVTTSPEDFWKYFTDDTCEVLDVWHVSEGLDRLVVRKNFPMLH
jgi:hypothetical protein